MPSTPTSPKRVVLVGADFAPSSRPPALRLRFFAQHLREFGWEPTVLTTDPAYYSWPVDKEIERLLPPDLRVIRTAALSAQRARFGAIGDIGLRSLWHHWRVLSHLSDMHAIDLVFIAMPPYIPAVLGRLVNDRYGIPYVIDYIDPWVNDYYRSVPVDERPGGRKWAWFNSVSRVLEPFALRHAAHLTTVSSGYLESTVARYPWLSSSDVTSIPYGGERADVDYVRRNPRANLIFAPHDGCLHLSYVGRGGVDMLPILRTLFEAIVLGLRSTPELFQRMRLHFVGTTYDPQGDEAYQVLPLARSMGLQHVIDEHPARISFLDALQTLADSHALIAVGSVLPYYTASKIFPFILSGRPLLALFHQASSVVQILEETAAGTVITFSDESDLKSRAGQVLENLTHLLQLAPDTVPPTRWDAFEHYSARSMARRLAEVFDRAVGADASRVP